MIVVNEFNIFFDLLFILHSSFLPEQVCAVALRRSLLIYRIGRNVKNIADRNEGTPCMLCSNDENIIRLTIYKAIM